MGCIKFITMRWSIIVFFVVELLMGCTKSDPPFTMSVRTSIDSLTFRPVTIEANTSVPAESYYWTFGDGTNATTSSHITEHTYQQMGQYQISCVARHNGLKDTAYPSLKYIKGDGRIINGKERHFYGTHTITTPVGINTLSTRTLVITDTIIVPTYHSIKRIIFLNTILDWYYDGPEVLYRNRDIYTDGTLKFYPASDSLQYSYSYGHMGYGETYTLSQKK